MIRQAMEFSARCEGKNCRRCRERRTTARLERMAARTAAGAFLLCGMLVLALRGNLATAIYLGVLAGGGALALTLRLSAWRRQKCADGCTAQIQTAI